MKTILNKNLFIGLLVLIACVGNSQGFVNLNFESANLTGYPPSSSVPATNAFPGWTVNAQYILYNDFSLNGESISIFGTNSFPPIQGKYFAVFIAGNNPEGAVPISLGQTGTIPIGTESISFWGNIGGLQITFAGQAISFSEIGSTANYNIYGADISQFAGDTGQLLFSQPPNATYANLDNIQFSSSPIPEPSALYLTTLGGLFITRWHMQKASRLESTS